MSRVFPILSLVLLAGPAAAQKDARPPVAAVVPSDTLGFIHVDVAALASKESITALAEQLAAAQGLRLADAGRGMFGAGLTEIDAFCVLVGDRFNAVAVRTRKAYDRDKVIAALVPGAKEATFQGKKYYARIPKMGTVDGLPPFGPALLFLDEETYVSGRVRDIQHFLEKSAKPDEEVPLLAAYSKAGAHHLTAAAAPPMAMLKEMKKELKDEARQDLLRAMAAHALFPLMEARRFVMTADADDVSKVEVSLGFADAADAAKGPEAIQFGLRMLAGGVAYLEQQMADALAEDGKTVPKKLRELMEQLQSSLRSGTVKSEGRQVRVSLEAKTDSAAIKAALAEVLPKMQQSAARVQSANNLKQLGIALHNYCSDNQDRLPLAWDTVPPAGLVPRPDKKPFGLSWRVHLLPYLEQGNLYKQFRLNESWDSEHNKKLIPLIPKVFAPIEVETKEKGMTFYQGVITAQEAQLHSVFCVNRLGQAVRRYSIGNIPDGTSNTLLFVEAADPVIWTKPDDIAYDGKEKLLPKLGGLFKDGFHAGICDGSVRFFRKKEVTEAFLKAFVGTDDGEITEYPGERRDRRGSGSDPDASPTERPKQPLPEKKPDEKK